MNLLSVSLKKKSVLLSFESVHSSLSVVLTRPVHGFARRIVVLGTQMTPERPRINQTADGALILSPIHLILASAMGGGEERHENQSYKVTGTVWERAYY